MKEDDSTLRKPRSAGKRRSTEQIEVTLNKIVNDPSVLLSFSESDKEMYSDFSQFFDLSEQSDSIASILNESEGMKKVYADLCPSKLTHNDFWCRYFYLKGQEVLARHRVGELEEDEEDLTWEGDEDEDERDDKSPSEQPAGPETAAAKGEGDAGEDTAEMNVGELLEELEALKADLKKHKVELASTQAENTRLKKLVEDKQPPASEPVSEGVTESSAEIKELKQQVQTLRAENEDLRKVVSLLNEEEGAQLGATSAKATSETDGKQDDVEVVKHQKDSEDWEGEGWSEWE